MKNCSLGVDGAVERPKAPYGAGDPVGRSAEGPFRPASEHGDKAWHSLPVVPLFLRWKTLYQNDFRRNVWHKCLPKPATLCHFLRRVFPEAAAFFTLLFAKKAKKEAASDGRPWPVPLE
jgi:hypothetical protein